MWLLVLSLEMTVLHPPPTAAQITGLADSPLMAIPAVLSALLSITMISNLSKLKSLTLWLCTGFAIELAQRESH